MGCTVYRWHITASDVVGAWSSAQPIEPYNKGVKANKIIRLRAPFEQVWTTPISALLQIDGKDLCEPIARAVPKNIGPSEVIEVANTYKATNVGEFQRRIVDANKRVFFLNNREAR